MTDFRRYAIYWAPPAGDWAQAAAQWLGWDPEAGRDRPQPDLGVPLADWTEEPRKYGFHGTLKAPFRLAEGWNQDRLSASIETLSRTLAPAALAGLALRRIGGFLALTVDGDAGALQALAARVVAELDAARAPLTPSEIQRRRPERLTPAQRTLLDLWGYPYVMAEFQFHLTLSGSLDQADLDRLQPLAAAHFAPHLPRPFVISALSLFGEAEDGRFHLLSRHALTG
jgi:putative phosphonate metabolism protein